MPWSQQLKVSRCAMEEEEINFSIMPVVALPDTYAEIFLPRHYSSHMSHVRKEILARGQQLPYDIYTLSSQDIK